jgi:hypothetical protein
MEEQIEETFNMVKRERIAGCYDLNCILQHSIQRYYKNHYYYHDGSTNTGRAGCPDCYQRQQNKILRNG